MAEKVSMLTNKYASYILPRHATQIHHFRSCGIQAEYRQKRCLILYHHYAQSPDLKPIEGIWLLLNEIFKKIWDNRLHQMSSIQLQSSYLVCVDKYYKASDSR